MHQLARIGLARHPHPKSRFVQHKEIVWPSRLIPLRIVLGLGQLVLEQFTLPCFDYIVFVSTAMVKHITKYALPHVWNESHPR
jgi:hypothetical protein